MLYREAGDFSTTYPEDSQTFRSVSTGIATTPFFSLRSVSFHLSSTTIG